MTIQSNVVDGNQNVSKQYLLGRFEEAVLLATMVCGAHATADAVRGQITKRLGERPITTIITTLERLTDKGYLDSRKEDAPTQRKGGKKRVVYSPNQDGISNLSKSLSVIIDMAKDAGLAA